MIHTIAKAAALAALAVGVPAQACSYTQRPEPVGYASGQYFAKVMLNAATYVDLVLVEDDGVRAMGEQSSGVLTLRTLARLKGNSADRFTVFGQGMSVNGGADRVFNAQLEHFTSEAGQVTPFPYNQERPIPLLEVQSGDPPPPPMALTSCSPAPIGAQTGRFYVVMRDGGGRVLGGMALSDGKTIHPNHAAFGFVPVSLDEDAFWLWSVQMAALNSDSSLVGPRLIHLQPGSDGVAAERAIRNAGAQVRAAFYARGGFIEEVRPSPAEQARPWLAKVRAYLAGSQRGRMGLPYHGGADYLREHLTPMQRYGTGLAYEVAQAFIASRRKSGDAMDEPRLVALEVDGDAQTFAGENFVARIAPLDVAENGLPRIAGHDETAVFETMQRIERDIWLLNGGAGNPQGTLP